MFTKIIQVGLGHMNEKTKAHQHTAEELNRVPLNNVSSIPDAQKFYGYPYCFTAWDSSALSSSSFNFQTGAQFSIRNPPDTPDDNWCSLDQNNIKPTLSMQAHSAPLDIVFYNAPQNATARQYAIDTQWDGHAFVSFHGSWNRNPPTGKRPNVSWLRTWIRLTDSNPLRFQDIKWFVSPGLIMRLQIERIPDKDMKPSLERPTRPSAPTAAFDLSDLLLIAWGACLLALMQLAKYS